VGDYEQGRLDAADEMRRDLENEEAVKDAVKDILKKVIEEGGEAEQDELFDKTTGAYAHQWPKNPRAKAYRAEIEVHKRPLPPPPPLPSRSAVPL